MAIKKTIFFNLLMIVYLLSLSEVNIKNAGFCVENKGGTMEDENGIYIEKEPADYKPNSNKNTVVNSNTIKTLVPVFNKGWSRSIPYFTQGKKVLALLDSPTIKDIDGDGKNEALIAYGHNVYIYRENGEFLDGWPQKIDYCAQSAPKAADLDNDGSKEVLVPTNSYFLYIFNYDGTTFFKNPILMPMMTASANVADLDGDGESEIILVDSLKGTGRIGVVDMNGNFCYKWPYVVPGGGLVSKPVIIDIDGDGGLEIICTMDNGKIYALHYDGTLIAGWPIDIGASHFLYPCAGDVDLDGKKEIVITNKDNQVFLLNSEGVVLANNFIDSWLESNNAKLSNISAPILADIDGDNDLEILVTAKLDVTKDNMLFVWHHDGRLVKPWPVIFEKEVNGLSYGFSVPVAGDVNGDNKKEIIVQGNYSGIIVFNNEGSFIGTFPNQSGFSVYSSCTNTPIIVDIDNDGGVEIISILDNLYDLDFRLEEITGNIDIWIFHYSIPKISIELNQNYWELKMCLNERKDNLLSGGKPMHLIKNIGNVMVDADIGYEQVLSDTLKPGLEPGFNVFSTLVGKVSLPDLPPDNEILYTSIPPIERIKIGHIKPDSSLPLMLMYCAPKGLMPKIEKTEIRYEIRAYLSKDVEE